LGETEAQVRTRPVIGATTQGAWLYLLLSVVRCSRTKHFVRVTPRARTGSHVIVNVVLLYLKMTGTREMLGYNLTNESGVRATIIAETHGSEK
jgi:hypothetical protein